MSRALNAIALTAIMVVSLFAGGTVADVGIGQQAETAAPTEITSCTTIDSPGRYVLTQDFVRSDGGEGPCIEIRTSDVTVDGNGHVIDGNTTELSSERHGIATTAAHPVDNVTVANLTLRQNRDNIRFHSVSDARITNVSSQSPEVGSIIVRESDHVEISDSYVEGSFLGDGLSISNSENLSVEDNTFSDGDSAIQASGMNQSEISDNALSGSMQSIDLESGSDNVIANNTVQSDPNEGFVVHGTNNTVVGNSIDGFDGLVLSGANHTVANNDAGGIGWAASAEGVNHTFRNNTFSGGEPEGASGGALRVSGSGYVIENNSLAGFNGVYVASATGPISIENNRLDGFRLIVVAESKLCPDPGVVVTAHGNVFEPMFESYQGDNYYGVLNHDDDVVNATNNYWGADSGPSSHDGENVTDPVTGTAADGDGRPVSEGVHFDPYLEQPPENAGVENGTAS